MIGVHTKFLFLLGAEISALQEPMDILVLKSADVKMEHVRPWMAGVIVQ